MKRHLLCGAWCLFWPLLSGCDRQPPVKLQPPPYPDSYYNIELNWGTHVRLAQGSDNWPVTWSADNSQTTSFGDGGGFNGTNRRGRVSLGFARVSGEKDDYVGTNIWGGVDAPCEAIFDGKSYGIIDIDGTLYAWWGPGSNARSYEQTRLVYSDDFGCTWIRSSWDLKDLHSDLVMPTILNFGPGYTDARDTYVYHYFIRMTDSSRLGIHGTEAGYLDLARVPSESILDLETYEWFEGMHSGRPRWTSDVKNRQPVFKDVNGIGWNVSAVHNNGLNKYLLITEHGQSFAGLAGIFEADEPWGEWRTIKYYGPQKPFGDGVVDPTTFYWNFSNKWTSEDGSESILIFTGTGENDSWNTIEVKFTLAN